MSHNPQNQTAARAQRLEEMAKTAKRNRRRRRIQMLKAAPLAVLGALGGVALGALLFLPPFALLIMLAFGLLHSVFAVVPAIGFIASVKVYVAVILLKMAVGTRQSTSS